MGRAGSATSHTLLDPGAAAAISDTALTRDVAIEMGANGLPNTFVPGRNLVFLTFAAALAYRRGITHIVGGMCETDYSGYPDCRDDTIKAMQVALNLGMEAVRAAHAADVDRQGRDAGSWRKNSAARRWSTSSASSRTPAISANAARARLGLWLRRLSGVPSARRRGGGSMWRRR